MLELDSTRPKLGLHSPPTMNNICRSTLEKCKAFLELSCRVGVMLHSG